MNLKSKDVVSTTQDGKIVIKKLINVKFSEEGIKILEKHINHSALNISMGVAPNPDLNKEEYQTTFFCIVDESQISVSKILMILSIINTIVIAAIDYENAKLIFSTIESRFKAINKGINGMYGNDEKPAEQEAETKVPNGNKSMSYVS